MTDEPFYTPHHKRAAAPHSQPGEVVFEFGRGDDRFRCELRDRGQDGAEAQFFQNEELVYSRGFYPSLNPTQTPREMAAEWAEQERKRLEKGGA